MGHVVMTSELAGVAEHQVLHIEETRDPKRRAIFSFARKVSREPASITQEDVDSLRPYLKDAQIVELVFAVCRYNTMNRLADAFGVPLERENVFAPPAKGKGGAGGTRKAKPAEVVAPPREAEARATEPARRAAATVAAVDGNRVTIDAGSADGVRAGAHIGLSRGAQYVGDILIARVDGGASVGLFDATHGGSAAPPQVGDRAHLETD